MNLFLHTIFGKLLISTAVFFILANGLWRNRKTAAQNGRWIGAFLSALAIFNTPYPYNANNADILFQMALLGTIWFVIGFAIGYAWKYFKIGKSYTPNVVETNTLLASTEESSLSTSNNEESIWEDVYKEFESDKRQLGLWAKCFTEADGNENVAKSQYIKQRVEQIKNQKN